VFALKSVLALLTVLSVTLAGCASQMQVKPEELISTQVLKTNRIPAGTVKIAVADFSLKTDKPPNQVGEAKTGFFNMPTPITFEKPANLIISNAVKKGLSGEGAHLVALGEADYNIDGTVETLWVDEYATGISLEYAKALVKYDVMLKDRNGKILWATTIESFKTSEIAGDATHLDVPTLQAALDDSVSKLLEDAAFWDALSH